jgi:hypothetical protein
MVFELCRAPSVLVVVAMAGGYSSDIARTGDIDFSTVEPLAVSGARRNTASLPRFVTPRALQLRDRAFCFQM